METLTFLMTASFYPPYHLGGDAVHVKYLAEALARRGHEVHVEFSPAAARAKGIKVDAAKGDDVGVTSHPIPASWGSLQPVSALVLGTPASIMRHHRDLIARLRPDVIHYHNLSLLGLRLVAIPGSALKLYTAHDFWVTCPRNDLMKYGRRLCERKSCFTCTIVSKRPPQLWRYRQETPRLFRSLHAAIAPSQFMRRTIEGLLPCPTVHLPNFAPDSNPSRLPGEPGDYFLYVGRLETHKGVQQLLDAASIYRGPYRFIIVGKGSLRSRAKMAEKAKPGTITVLEWLSPDDLDRLYSGARAVLLPSVWHENSPLVAIESMCWGAPILCSNRGGLPELLHGGSAGLAFPPSAEGILGAVDEFETGDSPQTLRRGSRQAYEAHHTPDLYVQRYAALLDTLWSQRDVLESIDPSPQGKDPGWAGDARIGDGGEG